MNAKRVLKDWQLRLYGKRLYETSKKLHRKLWRANKNRTRFAWRTRCNFPGAILNSNFKPCAIVCIYNSINLSNRPSVGLLSFLTYLGRWNRFMTQFSFTFLPWLIALDNFVCCCGKTFYFRLVELLLLSLIFRRRNDTFKLMTSWTASSSKRLIYISVFFLKFRRPAGTVFEIILPVVLIGVLILPK